MSLQLNKRNRIIIVNLLLLITFLPTRGGEEVAGVILWQPVFRLILGNGKHPDSRQIPQQRQRQITRDLSTAGVIICRFAKDYDIYQIKI